MIATSVITRVSISPVIAAGPVKSIVLTSLGSPGGTSQNTSQQDATVLSLATNVALGGHRVVCGDSGYVEYADCTRSRHIGKVIGITTGAVDAGSVCSVKWAGEVFEPSWQWDTQRPIYLGANGVMTQEVNPAAVFVQVVGFARTPTSIFVALREPIALI